MENIKMKKSLESYDWKRVSLLQITQGYITDGKKKPGATDFTQSKMILIEKNYNNFFAHGVLGLNKQKQTNKQTNKEIKGSYFGRNITK